MGVSITTAEIMDRLPGPTDWRRDPLVRHLRSTSGDLPPLGFLVNEAVWSEKASCRAAGLFTLRMRYAADGMATYVTALRDRSGEVSLLAATAIAELGDDTQLKEFFDWARRRISRKSRLDNWDMHELPALLQYGHRIDAFGQLPDSYAAITRTLPPTSAPSSIDMPPLSSMSTSTPKASRAQMSMLEPSLIGRTRQRAPCSEIPISSPVRSSTPRTTSESCSICSETVRVW